MAVLCCAAACCAAEPEPRWRTLNHAARQAQEAGDYAGLRRVLVELRPLLPGNPQIAYNLAACEAKLGNREAAVAALRGVAGMGLVYDLAADSDFASLPGTPGWAAILRQMERNRRPVARAREAFPLAEPDLIPEDIAYDARTARFFVSSVRKAKILTGDGREFARTKWPVLALAVDGRRRLLWATSGWMPQCERCAAEDRGKSVLLAFDIDSAAQVRRIEAPGEGVLSDMTIAPAGDLYVSSSSAGAVYHLAPDGKAFSRVDTPGEFASPQTPALSADGGTLYVPDYLRGIAAIDLQTRALRWLAPAEGTALSGIDGLYVTGDAFLAVQNGTEPRRVMRVSLDLTKQLVLEANTPGLGEPTHGVIAGSAFYFLANTGWDRYDRTGKKKDAAPVTSSVRRIDLGRLAGATYR